MLFFVSAFWVHAEWHIIFFQLYKAAKDARLLDVMPVTFVELEAKYGFGHLDIPHAPEFVSIIR